MQLYKLPAVREFLKLVNIFQLGLKVKVKEVDLYSAFIVVPHTVPRNQPTHLWPIPEMRVAFLTHSE